LLKYDLKKVKTKVVPILICRKSRFWNPNYVFGSSKNKRSATTTGRDTTTTDYKKEREETEKETRTGKKARAGRVQKASRIEAETI